MALTAVQVAQYGVAIKANILASPDLVGQQDTVIAGLYNAAASPTFTVWKSEVTIRQTGQAFVGTEWAGMTSANHTRLQTVAQYLMAYNPSIQGIRDMFNDIWSGAGGVNTRAALLVLWKRPALRIEKLLATGTGSDAVPATLGFEGTISAQNVSDILSQF